MRSARLFLSTRQQGFKGLSFASPLLISALMMILMLCLLGGFILLHRSLPIPQSAPHLRVQQLTASSVDYASEEHNGSTFALLNAVNLNEAFSVSLNTGEGKILYAEGETISFKIVLERSAYLSIFMVDAESNILLLSPNAWNTTGFHEVKAGEKQLVQIPSPEMGLKFPIQGPHGRAFMKVIATTSPLKIKGVDEAKLKAQGFVSLGNFEKEADVIELEARIVAQGNFLTMEDVFKTEEWATDEIAFITQKEALPVEALTPEERKEREFIHAIRRQHYTEWQKLLKDNGKGVFVSGSKSAKKEEQKKKAEFVVFREIKLGNKKSIGGAAVDFEMELVQLEDQGNAKALFNPAQKLEQQIRSIKAKDDSIVAVIPNDYVFKRAQTQVVVIQEMEKMPISKLHWGLHNTYQKGMDIRWQEAREAIKGIKPVLTAILDDSYYMDDPRLAGARWSNTREIPGNGQDDDGNGLVDDYWGWDFGGADADMSPDGVRFSHGNFCGSIIAARPREGHPHDVIGVSPNSKLMMVKVFSGENASPMALLNGLVYAARNEAKVINMSLGLLPDSKEEGQILMREWSRLPLWGALQRKGVLLVIAAGNEDNNNDDIPALPASLPYDNIISVMAVDVSGQRGASIDPMTGQWEPYSNYGAKTVHIAAPGSYIIGASNPGRVGRLIESSGTSYAAPMVAGIAALVWGKNPDWTYLQVKEAILQSGTKVEGLKGYCQTGAIVNLEAALNYKAK